LKIESRIKLLWVIFYVAITLAGIQAYLLTKNGIDPKEPMLLQLGGLIGILMTAISMVIGINHWKKQLK
jgi:hypothetical protein